MSRPVISISDQEFNLFQTLIEKEIGVLLTKEKRYLIENRLSGLIYDSNCKTFSDFYFKMMNSKTINDFKQQIVEAITTRETYWFRNAFHFQIFNDVIMPQLVERLSKSRTPINIWSAASSTGQEAYSIAMTILYYCQQKKLSIRPKECFRILGTDVSEEAIDTAKAGIYSGMALNRGLPLGYKKRFFVEKDNSFQINDDVKALVNFEAFNLKDRFSKFPIFDIVFLRNVAIYFGEAFKIDLFDRVSSQMGVAGYLFLGAGETLSGYSKKFDILNHDGAVYYQKSEKPKLQSFRLYSQ